MLPEYIFTGDEKVPAVITFGKYSTPVWIQQNWQDGEFANFIRYNGCGHCCTAMALNLRGIKINPHEEFCFCRKMWGEPRSNKPWDEAPFLSVSGIVKVLESFGITAECFGVPKGKCSETSKHIEESLKNGKLVIFASHPSAKLADNPFSPGEHYVLAAGIDENGKILIANSSLRGKAENGIQHTDIETLVNALWEGCEPYDFTWGRNDLIHTCGYVVVGDKL